MQHLDEGTIHAWLDDALPIEVARGVEQHVAACAECAALVAEARGMMAGASRIVSSLDVVRGGVIPKQAASAPASRSLWRTLRLTPMRAALAASLMVAAATLLTVRHDGADKIILPTQTAAPAAIEADRPVISAQKTTQSTPNAPSPNAPPTVAGEARKLESAVLDATAKKPSASRNEVRRDAADARQRSVDSIGVAAAQKPAAVDVAAAAPAAPSAPAAKAASSVDLAKVSGDSSSRIAPGAGFAASRLQASTQFREMAAMRAAPPLPACYRLTADTASIPTSVPMRFALDQLGGDTILRVVRAVTPDGRVDSVLTGSRWAQSSPNLLTVRFGSTDKAQPVTMRLVPEGAAANANLDTRSRTLTVTRVDCRR